MDQLAQRVARGAGEVGLGTPRSDFFRLGSGSATMRRRRLKAHRNHSGCGHGSGLWEASCVCAASISSQDGARQRWSSPAMLQPASH